MLCGGLISILGLGLAGTVKGQDEAVSWEQYLRESAVSKEVIDTFLDPEEYSWAQFDSELGYILGSYLPFDGVDGSYTISTVQPNGARTARMYTDRPCRINTYGNSFTQCHQVSDGETWQEYLAAHLGEPIRNFGMGGYGVYQSYRRMVREEKTELGAEYLILYVWGDDHLRNLWRCRHAAIFKWWDHAGGRMFHNNFWPNLEMDLETGELLEKENLLVTPESLYKMTDPEFMYRTLESDLALQMQVFSRGLINEIDRDAISQLSRHLGLTPPDLANARNPREEVGKVLNKYGFLATKYVLRKAREFADANHKKLMIVLFDPSRSMRQLIENGTRYDQEIVDFLTENDYLFFDMNVVHAQDFKEVGGSLEDYRKRYFIGHYSPRGNHFFAFAIKPKIVEWLDPKPITYQPSEQRMVDFRGYLPD